MGVHTEAVQKLYVAYFGRPADVQGLAYWDNIITGANGSTAAVTQAFAASLEYKTVFDGLDENGIVDTIYHNLFGRAAETAALNFWGNGLRKGTFTIADAVTTIVTGAQGDDKLVFANKVAGATAFTTALDLASEVIAYTGTHVNEVLKAWMAGITNDASLASAVAGLNAFVDQILLGGSGLPSGAFEIFDTAGLNKTFDADSLLTHKQAIEFTASGSVGTASLINVAPSSTLRVTGDMGASTLSLTQKLAGALKITVDADETANGADVAIDTVTARIAATNATAIKVLFDTAFLPPVPGETAVGDNVATLNLSGVATKVDVAAGGSLAHDVLVYTDTSTDGCTTQITITGESDLTLSTVNAKLLATIDASQHMGGLVVSTAAVKDGGLIRLGSGADTVTVAATSTAGAFESISGFQKTALERPPQDVLSFGSVARVADANPGVTSGTILNGVLTFAGAGPADLNAAIAIADATAESAGEAVMFKFMNDTYVFLQCATSPDQLVRLVGLTTANALVELGPSDTFIIL